MIMISRIFFSKVSFLLNLFKKKPPWIQTGPRLFFSHPDFYNTFSFRMYPAVFLDPAVDFIQNFLSIYFFLPKVSIRLKKQTLFPSEEVEECDSLFLYLVSYVLCLEQRHVLTQLEPGTFHKLPWKVLPLLAPFDTSITIITESLIPCLLLHTLWENKNKTKHDLIWI